MTRNEYQPKPFMREGPHLQGADKQHRLIITQGKNQNRGFRVRCTCMAEYRNVSSRYFNYDTLTDHARDADEIKRVWRAHLESSP